MAEADVISASLSLMRRLPPNKVEQNLTGLTNLLPEETDELLQRIDQPLMEAMDVEMGRKYLQCDYNRDGDSYRSPWKFTIRRRRTPRGAVTRLVRGPAELPPARRPLPRGCAPRRDGATSS